MLTMDEVQLEGVSRLIFSKATVVKNLVKGKTAVKRESVFLYDLSFPLPQNESR